MMTEVIFTRESRMLRASLPSSGRLSVCSSVRLSVCQSHSWTVSKWCKLGSRNLHCGLPQGL